MVNVFFSHMERLLITKVVDLNFHGLVILEARLTPLYPNQ